jgi:hypothetical protein
VHTSPSRVIWASFRFRGNRADVIFVRSYKTHIFLTSPLWPIYQPTRCCLGCSEKISSAAAASYPPPPLYSHIPPQDVWHRENASSGDPPGLIGAYGFGLCSRRSANRHCDNRCCRICEPRPQQLFPASTPATEANPDTDSTTGTVATRARAPGGHLSYGSKS